MEIYTKTTPDGDLTAKTKELLKTFPDHEIKIMSFTKAQAKKEQEEKEKMSDNIRRYFEGALKEYVRLQHFQFSPTHKKYYLLSSKQTRAMLKAEYNGEYIPSVSGKWFKQGKSTKDLSKKQFKAFVERIVDGMQAQGKTIPDSQDFTEWQSKSGLPSEQYPPLAELKEWSERELTRLNNEITQ